MAWWWRCVYVCGGAVSWPGLHPDMHLVFFLPAALCSAAAFMSWATLMATRGVCVCGGGGAMARLGLGIGIGL